MFLNNLNASWHYLKQNPLFTLINIAGLVTGITCALFIFIYVSFETSYDRFHAGYENIYRVIGIDSAQGVSSSEVGITMPPLGPAMEEAIAGVEKTARLQVPPGGMFVTVGNENYYADVLVSTDDAFFDIFTFPLLQRQGEVLLDKPHSAVLTESFASKVFGSAGAMGKILRVRDQDFEVVGIMADPPPDSHMQFDLLVSLNFLSPEEEGAQEFQDYLNNWGTISMITYARLEPGTSETAVEEQLKTLVAERGSIKTFSATLQPLQDAHLDSSAILFDDFNVNKGDAQKVVMLASVAFFLLLIAAFNFMNLSTARASLRAREIGMRKVHGATRSQLIRQFLLESLLLVGSATVLSVALLWLLEPLVSLPLAEGFLSFLFGHRQTVFAAALALVGIGLLAGSYPAFVLSSFAPIVVLKGKFANTTKGIWLRRLLVVLQFALSISIIIGMLVVNQQLAYMRNINPGFERDGIVNVILNNQTLGANAEVLKNRLLEIPQVLAVAGSSNMPGQTFNRSRLRPFGAKSQDSFTMSRLAVDSDYMDTLSMQLLAGRNYSPEYPADARESIMLNESAVKALGWTNAVGRTIQMDGNQQRTVIGVVRDFHFADMRHPIEPVMILAMNGRPPSVLSIRIDRNFPREALDDIAAAWEEINPDFPFSYTFFTDEYNQLFSDDAEFSAMLNQFTFVAAIIACLGLYGLASFSADQRTREIGIRKVLGATRLSLLRLVLKEYVVLIAVASLLAWGAAWYVMQAWLAGFVYRTELPLSSFVLATAGTLLLALCTVADQCWRSASADPMRSLRYE